jgi:hypothetical protein
VPNEEHISKHKADTLPFPVVEGSLLPGTENILAAPVSGIVGKVMRATGPYVGYISAKFFKNLA